MDIHTPDDRKSTYTSPHIPMPSPDKLMVAQRLKDILRSCGLSVREAADIMGVSPQLIHGVIRGYRNMTKKRSDLLVEFLNSNPRYRAPLVALMKQDGISDTDGVQLNSDYFCLEGAEKWIRQDVETGIIKPRRRYSATINLLNSVGYDLQIIDDNDVLDAIASKTPLSVQDRGAIKYRRKSRLTNLHSNEVMYLNLLEVYELLTQCESAVRNIADTFTSCLKTEASLTNGEGRLYNRKWTMNVKSTTPADEMPPEI